MRTESVIPSWPRSTAALLKMVKPYVEYNNLTAEIAQAEALLAGADAEMRAMIEEEVVSLRTQARFAPTPRGLATG